jgi:FkbM family methyltransferase
LCNNWKQIKDSYAQHGENKLIENLLPKSGSSFLDIGANGGDLFPNTYKFAKDGASGFCIKPSRSSYLKLKLNHIFNFQTKSLQLAISQQEGAMFLKEDGYENVLFNVSQNKANDNYPVKTTSLVELLKRFPKFRSPELVSIDVEGLKEKVIQRAGDFLINSKVIILEVDKSNLINLLCLPALQNHYPAYSNGINLFFSC